MSGESWPRSEGWAVTASRAVPSDPAHVPQEQEAMLLPYVLTSAPADARIGLVSPR